MSPSLSDGAGVTQTYLLVMGAVLILFAFVLVIRVFMAVEAILRIDKNVKKLVENHGEVKTDDKVAIDEI